MFVAVLPPRVQAHLDAVRSGCERLGAPLVAMLLFGSASRGGFSNVSDVDLILVVPDRSPEALKQEIREEAARLEILHGFRPPGQSIARGPRARVERAVGHLFPCVVCARSDLLSGDAARVLGLKRWEAPFVDRITFASIVGSAVTMWGEDLLPQVHLPPIRTLDVYKALFAFACQTVLCIEVFLFLDDATKYAMSILKHSLHSCFFCYHGHTAPLEEEVAFFRGRVRAHETLTELLSLRSEYHRSFPFVIRCMPALVQLHLRTARDNRFRS